jgi:hypothetical protein
MTLAPSHMEMLAQSGVTHEYALARGYETITEPRRLAEIGLAKDAQKLTPGLLVPMLRNDGSVWGYQYRPNRPRTLQTGRTIKYETPTRQRNGIDFPRPAEQPRWDDPDEPLFVTEGVKKADAATLAGLCCVALPGVWSWIGKGDNGGKVALSEWRDLALNDRRVILAFDGDVARKESVQKAMHALACYLATKGARIEYLWLPDTDSKTGLDDYLQEHTVRDLWTLVRPTKPSVTQPPKPGEEPKPAQAETVTPAAEPRTLAEAHAVFTKWLGTEYDLDALNAQLAAVAAEKFDDGSDPAWLLIVSGPGNAKTETAQSLSGVDATVVSSLSGEAALLSATSKKDVATDASGGLLRQIGERGVLVVKDVTSILSMNGDARAGVLAALREIYDGYWSRSVGTDGGAMLEWKGRLCVVGAVTTAWDTAHAVISSMGDRFLLVRLDSGRGTARIAAGRRAIGNTGSEKQMRKELAAAVAGVIAGMSTEPVSLSDEETDAILRAADLVTLSRTACEYDYRGNVIDAHAPEAPTRFAKQLTQIVRGAVAVGMERRDAMRLAIRIARDSMPPLRLAILDQIAAQPGQSTAEIRKAISKPWTTVDRQLQSLHMLGVIDMAEIPYGSERTRWIYSLAEGVDPEALRSALAVPTSSPFFEEDTPNPTVSSEMAAGSSCLGSSQNGEHLAAGTGPGDPNPAAAPPPPASLCNTRCHHCDAPLENPRSKLLGQCEECRFGAPNHQLGDRQHDDH